MNRAKGFLGLAILALLVSCGGGGDEEDDSPTTTTFGNTSGGGSGSDGSSDGSVSGSTSETVISAFPASIVVSSPTSVTTIEAVASSIRATSASGYVTDYEIGTSELFDLLSSATDAEDEVEFDQLLNVNSDADCYGPYLPFEHHPDVSSTASDDVRDGELPSGDLGLWTVTEGDTDEACAAAQLNARLQSVNDKNTVALMSLASMVSAYETEGNAWPSDVAAGSSVDLVEAMNDLGIADTNFTAATMALDSVGVQWTYHLEVTYSLNLIDYKIVVNLEHVPGSTEGTYEGLLTFLVNDTFTDGNCGEGENDVTLNGSLHYIHASESSVVLQYRETQFCDHDVDGIQTPVSSDVVSGNVVSVASTESFSDTWENNFTVFTAEFDPDTLGGSYSFAWQAGYNDSHSRILNVGLEAVEAGEAYFGFGDRIQNSEFDGGVKGFICNWAGPGNDHTLRDYVQRQHITLDIDLGLYTPTNHSDADNDSSDITYAPTNSCKYDSLEDGGFVFGGDRFEYDRNLDLALDSTDIGDVVDSVTDSATQLEFGLRGVSDSSSAESIWGYITEDRGYDLPEYP